MKTSNVLLLCGSKDIGKTTVLRTVAEELICNGKSATYVSNVKNFFNSQMTANKKVKDVWVIFQYNDKTIYVATKGDSDKHTSANVAFFRQDYARFHQLCPRGKIYIFDTNGNAISIGGTLQQQPLATICISASHFNQKTINPLLDFAMKGSTIEEAVMMKMRDNAPYYHNNTQMQYPTPNHIHYRDSIIRFINSLK